MELIKVTFILAVVLSLSLAVAWLDHKKNWRLIDWFNGKVSNPFKQSELVKTEQTIREKDQTIAELRERIEVLEKIVTEPAYELNKKINQL